MTITPIGNRALLRDDEKEKISAGGIHLPETAKDHQYSQTAVVVAVGPGRLTKKNFLIEPRIKKGDRVVLAKGYGTELVIEGTQHRLVDIDVIEGVVED